MTKNKYRFTMVELLIVIAVIAILTCMLLPALKKAKDSVKRIDCLNRYKEIGSALMMYTGDFDEYVPGPSIAQPYLPTGTSTNSYVNLLNELYLKRSHNWWLCPSNGKEVYAIDYRIFALNTGGASYYFGYPSIALPKKLSVIMKDGSPSQLFVQREICKDTVASYSMVNPPHLGGWNVLYFDGHVKTERK